MYVLDTNIFIEAKRRYYGFDIAPRFWKLIEEELKRGKLLSVIPVYNELKAGEDELSIWAENYFDFFKYGEDDRTVGMLREVADWAGGAGFTQQAVADFLSAADYVLVAYAAAYELTVVTHERFEEQAKKRVLIPNACRAFNVEYTDTFEMMRRLGIVL